MTYGSVPAAFSSEKSARSNAETPTDRKADISTGVGIGLPGMPPNEAQGDILDAVSTFGIFRWSEVSRAVSRFSYCPPYHPAVCRSIGSWQGPRNVSCKCLPSASSILAGLGGRTMRALYRYAHGIGHGSSRESFGCRAIAGRPVRPFARCRNRQHDRFFYVTFCIRYCGQGRALWDTTLRSNARGQFTIVGRPRRYHQILNQPVEKSLGWDSTARRYGPSANPRRRGT